MKQLNIVLVAAGTPVQFTGALTNPTGFLPARACLVQAVKKGTAQDNVTNVYVMVKNPGDAAPNKANGFVVRLAPGESVPLPIGVNESLDLSTCYMDGETNGDELQVTYA